MRIGVGPAGIPPPAVEDDQQGLMAFLDRVEQFGYDAVCVGDHLDDRGAPLALLAAAAVTTRRVTLATHVLCAAFRNAALVAHEARTVHALSGGRLELGLGIGWLQADFEAAGVAMRPFPDRLEHLDAMVRQVREHSGWGRAGAPRIVLGGGGDTMLATAARLADIVTLNIPLRGSAGLGANTLASGTRPLVQRRIARVREEAARHDRDVELHLYVHQVHTGDGWMAAAEAAAGRAGLSTRELLASPHVLAGDPAGIAEVLAERRQALGVDYISIPGTALEAFAPVLGHLD